MTKLKWCIKRTEENYKEVNEWASETFGLTFEQSNYYLHSERAGEEGYLLSYKKHPDFKEITLDEFRLLTDPEKYRDRVFEEYGNVGLCWSFTNDEGERTSCSAAVFSELQRMFMERESEKAIRVKESVDVEELRKQITGEDIFEGKIETFTHMIESESEYQTRLLKNQSKLLKKIDKKLTKLIKKQSPKRHEKTIM